MAELALCGCGGYDAPSTAIVERIGTEGWEFQIPWQKAQENGKQRTGARDVAYARSIAQASPIFRFAWHTIELTFAANSQEQEFFGSFLQKRTAFLP